MDKKSLKALEFNKILSDLREFAFNEFTKERLDNLEPYTDKKIIKRLLEELDQTVKLILNFGRLPISTTTDIKNLVKKSKIDSILSPEELLSIGSFLNIIGDLKNYYNSLEKDIDINNINDLFITLNEISELKRQIFSKIIGINEIADNASKELLRIRKEKERINLKIDSVINRILNNSNNEKYLQEKLVSIRNDRLVIPVKAEYKNKIPGAVLDRSSTGSTVFIEPLQVLELNNQLNELNILEQKEINRILKDLTKQINYYSDELLEDYKNLLELDFINAKANYSINNNLFKANLIDSGIDLKKARHPLLDINKAVASNIKIDEDIKTLVITGPNTGGKTVSLKTIGLIAAMNQAGLFIPAKENSAIQLFENIYADIGDEQSIEQSLSTFSSHMVNIVNILENQNNNSLILFDEIGAGTDPIEGAALAISILDFLKNTNNLTIATTHYAEIKEFALVEDNVQNASVEFDIDSLKPTYRLILGLPGKSNAFEIAKRLGLSDEIINDSRTRINSDQKEIDQILAQTQKELKLAREDRQKARTLKKKTEEIFNKVNQEKEKVLKRKESIIQEAVEEADKILNQTKKETDRIYKEIQQLQSQSNQAIDNKYLESLRKDLKNNQKTISKKSNKPKLKNTNSLNDFKNVKKVIIDSLGREADVVKIIENKNQIEVISGSIRMKFKPNELTPKLSLAKEEKTTIPSYSNKGKMNTKLDLRGLTVDESIDKLDAFLNEALMLNQRNLEVIHGFGTGKVREAVHSYLKKSKFIKNYRLGKPGEGGAGATIIELK